MYAFRYIGRKTIDLTEVLYSVWSIIIYSITTLIFRFSLGIRAYTSVLLKQIYFTAFEALSIITLLSMVVGLIVVTQAVNILPKLGDEMLIGEIVVWVMVRELGPLFAAVIVIARSGTAVASELGTMKISRVITSLEVMGIEPKHYLVMPRVVAMAVSLLVLTVYFDVLSILSGYLLAGFGKRITFSVYISSIIEAADFLDIVVSILKSLFFGLIIGGVCTYRGLMVKESITEVPQQTTKAVIESLGLVFVINGLITFVFYS